MPKQRYERREPTHEWSQIRPLLKNPTQIHFEILRPIVLFGVSPKERVEETGTSKSSLYTKAHLLDQAGMASLLPPVPPPEIPRHDKHTLPPPMRQAIVDAKAEHPGLSRYSVEWQPDEKHLQRVGNPRLYNHPNQSGQLELWPAGSVEWYVILRAQPYGPRHKKKRLVFLQLPLLKDGDGTHG
jgi:hypothetical protein